MADAEVKAWALGQVLDILKGPAGQSDGAQDLKERVEVLYEALTKIYEDTLKNS